MFKSALQLAIALMDALPEARPLKDAVRNGAVHSSRCCAVPCANRRTWLRVPVRAVVGARSQARFLFQRLVGALGRDILPYLAPMIVRLVRDCHLPSTLSRSSRSWSTASRHGAERWALRGAAAAQT